MARIVKIVLKEKNSVEEPARLKTCYDVAVIVTVGYWYYNRQIDL